MAMRDDDDRLLRRDVHPETLTQTTAPLAPYPDDNPKTVVGVTKPALHAIPPSALLHLGAAMADGERKYGLFNWRQHAVSTSIYVDAMYRHLLAYQDGEDRARDSGRHHLAHVMACAAILLDASESGNLRDDRGPSGPAADIIERMTRLPASMP